MEIRIETPENLAEIRRETIKNLLMEMMELKNRENFLNNYLNPSMETGLMEPLYPDHPKHPRQKYRLTGQGKALLKKKR